MSLPQLLELFVVRQRRTFLAVLTATFLLAALVTLLLPDQYRAEATLVVGENRPLSAGASVVQLDDVLARTYVSLLRTPDVERAVVDRLPFALDRGELADKVDIEVVTGTRLIRLAALDEDPERARLLADAYATAFVSRQRTASEASARERLASLQERIGELAQEVGRLAASTAPDEVAARARAETELQATRDAYYATQQNLTSQGSNVALASRATLPESPARPRPKLYLALGLLLALGLAVAAALLRDRFDDRLRDEDDLIALVDAPILARVPVEQEEGRAAVHEAFDLLHANLRALGPEPGWRVLAVSSPVPDEGKSFTVLGLAAAFARLGTSVLVVDCDLRRPMLGTYLEIGEGKGLTNLLVEEPRDPGGLIVPTSTRGVHFLPSGPLPPSPSALLGMGRMREVVDDLRGRHDQLLLDAPPVTAGADVTALGPRVDGVVLVVDLSRSGRRAILASRDQLERSGARLAGVVLNRVRGWDRGYGVPGYGGYGPQPAPAANGAGRLTRARGRLVGAVPRRRPADDMVADREGTADDEAPNQERRTDA